LIELVSICLLTLAERQNDASVALRSFLWRIGELWLNAKTKTPTSKWIKLFFFYVRIATEDSRRVRSRPRKWRPPRRWGVGLRIFQAVVTLR